MLQSIEPAQELILASASPRRKELLQLLGVKFQIEVADIDETPQQDEAPNNLVLRLAKEKAKIVAERLSDSSAKNFLVLAADTTVVHNGVILNKPESELEAFEMLKALQGKSHKVMGGIALYNPADKSFFESVEITQVEFVPISDATIKSYIKTGEPMDKAGSYGAQGYGARFIKKINGSYTNVVGLDIALVATWLTQTGLLRNE